MSEQSGIRKKLKEKKYRDICQSYIIEGIKLINEAINENANIKQQQIENEQIFNQVCVLVLQKETYSKVYEFLKEEASDEE